MAERRTDVAGMTGAPNQPLIGVPTAQDDGENTRYFVGDDAADAAAGDSDTDQVLRLAGCWRDLEWHEIARALDHIRHDSEPSPPVAL